ncbi:unnamed protein product [Effrenium voratum]|uniref:Uncharacterized protein n=1 Tax=Effrenium voratum TaxID=2562239 RepID=A0AA36HM52_9DINO|nr:unnamed protein product [Effrenium voratum]CAJ1423335.1 unnamed protein product [Effrenium voratum]
MEKLTKFVKEQSLQRSERSSHGEELVQWLVELGARGEKAAADMGFASSVANMATDRDDAVAAAAITTLGDLGAEGAKHMGAVASGLNRSPEVVVAAATALARFGTAAAAQDENLATCLERLSHDGAKAAVLAALGAVKAESHAHLVVKYLDDPSMAVSCAACQALGNLSSGAQEAPRIALKLKDPAGRFAAATALGKLGPHVVQKNLPELVACLKDKDSLTRQAAGDTLAVAADVVSQDGQGIASLLKDPAPGIRCTAALALGKLGPKGAAYAAEVAELLRDTAEDESESYLAVGGGSLRSDATLRRPKCAALASLSRMQAESHLNAIAAALRDTSYEVRLAALDAIMHMGPSAKKYSTSVMSVMEDDVYLVRLKSCQCIAAIGATDVMDNLPDLFQDEAPSVRQGALEALATNPEIAKKYSSQVFKLMADEYGCVRGAAMRCLASMDTVGQCYASAIAGELTSQDPEARAAACETLGRLGDYGAAFAEEVEVCQQDEVPMVRAAAATAMVRLGGMRGLENGS